MKWSGWPRKLSLYRPRDGFLGPRAKSLFGPPAPGSLTIVSVTCLRFQRHATIERATMDVVGCRGRCAWRDREPDDRRSDLSSNALRVGGRRRTRVSRAPIWRGMHGDWRREHVICHEPMVIEGSWPPTVNICRHASPENLHRMFLKSAPPLLSLGAVSRLRRWATGFVDLVYPPQCALCGALPTDDEPRDDRELLCRECLAAMVDRQPACSACGGPLPTLSGRSLACPRCHREPTRFEALVRLGRYDGPLREAVLRTKRSHGVSLATSLAAALARERREQLAALDLQMIAPVPMHWTLRIWRGAHGPETIAAALARRLAIPLDNRLLRQVRATRSQHDLTPAQHRANVRGAFRVSPRRSLAGARVLVVDDVLTTGATANEAARVLHREARRWWPSPCWPALRRLIIETAMAPDAFSSPRLRLGASPRDIRSLTEPGADRSFALGRASL